ncbi:DUF4390 domain-containing protein [Limnobacter humi]|uniref:DUF4390 domain-containing protein n=1 Tax=Limnobacter humi TaxID=1778671 RepID=A0ABT1WGM8_9BURK|nr:DUF4390 domain-containing protein [Limnobacter humi]MCQ8895584.1 DUF4390 domain-containing protein [Limnobacter humi]
MKLLEANLTLHRAWQALLWLVLACALIGHTALVHAQQDSFTRIKAVKLEPARNAQHPGWNLAAEFDIQLGQRLREALDRGLPLQFAVDFKLTKNRWYWMDEETASASYTLNLSYNALTRTYRLAMPSGVYNVARYEDALAQMVRVVDWPVLRKDQVKMGEPYTAQVRFRLVLTELPKPFQISALVNSEWDLSSEWLSFEFTPRQELLK